MAMTREEMLEQSVEDHLRSYLFTIKGLPKTQVILYDAFDYKNFTDTALDKEYVTFGFSFDDGGRTAELGSDLRVRIHTLEVWIFTTTPDRGRNLGAVVSHALEGDNGRIPLKDYSQAGDPQIDVLVIEDPGPRSQRQPHPDPKPWQENAWTVTVKVRDEYFASAV